MPGIRPLIFAALLAACTLIQGCAGRISATWGGSSPPPTYFVDAVFLAYPTNCYWPQCGRFVQPRFVDGAIVGYVDENGYDIRITEYREVLYHPRGYHDYHFGVNPARVEIDGRPDFTGVARRGTRYRVYQQSRSVTVPASPTPLVHRGS